MKKYFNLQLFDNGGEGGSGNQNSNDFINAAIRRKAGRN